MKGLIFIYLVSYGGSFFAVFNPFIGLCSYYSFAILRPQTLWEWALEGAYDEPFSKYLALATMAGFLFLLFRENKPRNLLRLGYESNKKQVSLRGGGGTFLSLLLLVGIVHLSTANPTMILEGGYVDYEYGSALTKNSLMLLIGYYLINSLYRLRIFLWVLFLSQAYLTFELNVIYFVYRYNPILMNDGFGSLNNNGFAMSLLPIAGLGAIVSLYEKKFLLKWLAIFCVLSSIHVILLSESRGAYLGLLAIAFVASYLLQWNLKTVFLFLFLAIIIGFAVGESVQNEFMTIFAEEEERDQSAESRFDLWALAIKIMGEHPILGIGPGRFNDFYYAAHGGEGNVWKSPHNLYLRIGAECGIFALFLVIFFYFSILRGCYKLFPKKMDFFSKRRDPLISGVVGGVFAGLLGFMVHSFFSDGMTIESTFAVILPALSVFRFSYTVQYQNAVYGMEEREASYAVG